MGRPRLSIADRFWPKVTKLGPDDCWLWTAKKDRRGYGLFSTNGPGEECLAHRVSWTLYFGPVPNGSRVLHRCDVTACVNPSHLFLGSAQDNSDDMVRKGRSMKGEKSPVRKLVEAEVKEIRRLYSTGEYSQQAIADVFKVNQTCVGFIVRRITWSHI